MSDIVITTSWDDGHPLDNKLGKLLSNYKIPGTFYIPWVLHEKEMMTKDEIKSLSQEFEIGGHTLNHSVLTQLSKNEMYDEIIRGKEKMENLCGEISSFAYPKGQYNSDAIDAVKKAGFTGARTADYLRCTIKDIFEQHPTIHAFNQILASRGKHTLLTHDKGLAFSMLSSRTIFKHWKELAIKTLDYVFENGGVWHLWGHSWEIDDNDDWNNLSDVLEYAHIEGKKHGAEFLPNNEIPEHFSKNTSVNKID